MGSKLLRCIMDIRMNISVLTHASIPVKSGSAQHARVSTSSLPPFVGPAKHGDPQGVPRASDTPGFEATCLASFSPFLQFPKCKDSRKLPAPGAAWPLPTTRKEDMTNRSLTTQRKSRVAIPDAQPRWAGWVVGLIFQSPPTPLL